ncbi:MAG: methyl-accepting chemotaxis protein, partial [Gallionellaceae bacterium]|nr:methyl-accepting chemotaxis protein [Gallionellaceae bacterium]
MNKWWYGLSLSNKLQFPIQAALLVVLSIAQAWLMGEFEAKMNHSAAESARSSAMQSFLALNGMMLSGTITDAEARKTFIQKMASQDGVLDFHIVRGKAISDVFGPGLPEENKADELDNAAMSSNVVQKKITDGKVHSLRVVVPIAASQNFHGTNCLTCHVVPEGTVNGAVSLTLNLEAEKHALERLNFVLWGGQIGLQVLLFFLIGALIKNVTDPADRLEKTMLEIKANGDLSKRAPITSGDEIGRMAGVFNSLVDSFQQIVREVHGHADEVTSAAQRLSSNANQVAENSQRQSDAASNTAGAVEQMSSSIGSVADATKEVASLSQESLRRANSGQDNLKQMMGEINQVESAVKQMAEAVQA